MQIVFHSYFICQNSLSICSGTYFLFIPLETPGFDDGFNSFHVLRELPVINILNKTNERKNNEHVYHIKVLKKANLS